MHVLADAMDAMRLARAKRVTVTIPPRGTGGCLEGARQVVGWVRRCRLLVVEDDDSVARFLALLLGEDARLEVVGRARHGEEALELVEALRPDVVLTDLEMPVMDGVELTRRLAEGFP